MYSDQIGDLFFADLVKIAHFDARFRLIEANIKFYRCGADPANEVEEMVKSALSSNK